MVTRRSTLAIAATFLSAGTAGCTDLLFGDGLEIEATPASVSESALQETGYEEHQVRDIVVEREVEAGGESRSVRATNWQAEYDKALDLSRIGPDVGPDIDGQRQRVATFSAVTTPRAEVLGKTLNPVGDMDPAEIVNMAQDRYEDFEEFESAGQTSVDLLGTTTVVEAFRGETQLTELDLTVELTLHVSEAVESGEDFALVVGGYPTQLSGTERDNVFTLIEGVQHDG